MSDKTLVQIGMIALTLASCYGILSSNPGQESRGSAIENPGREPASLPQARKKKENTGTLVIPLSPKEKSLMASLDSNYFERELKIAIVSRRHADKIQNGAEVGGQTIRKMKAYPYESLAAFQSLIAKLPAEEFPFDRASLIDVMADFPELKDAARKIAIDELATAIVKQKHIPQDLSDQEMNSYLTSDEFEFLPMVAHSVVLRTSPSQKEALDLTVYAISRQEDLEMRATLAGQFVAAYPKLEKNLNYELKRANIEMPVAQELLPN